ncbi:homeobox protein PKNOX2-like [Adelges cooleyi]|uniref:homeobox protein PKNOX2-like n=1 Tax=Adelges cooleyi TaxID=133065 RepID=UPI00217FF935|nr:homeobox protein PKNOX2-like [Adelges cooleyi]XP_050425759.1 homeobox protein PKNOX2-like [Adelges cooleyi]
MVSYSDSVATNLTAIANNNIQQPDQAVFEADKRAVYKHPLFPLLALLFERCEQATQSATISNSENFNIDIQAFVQHQERDRKPFLTNDTEIDGLMIKAIQVLRIHLLELEKVQELCKDFCSRYITCLKIKMQSENLLRSDYTTGYLDNNSSGNSSNSNSPLCHSPHHNQVISSSEASLRQSGDLDTMKPKTIMDLKNISSLLSGIPSSTSVEMKNVSQTSDISQLEMPVTQSSLPDNSALGKITLSTIGTNLLSNNSSSLQGSLSATSGGSCDEEDDYFGSKRKRQQKRGILPKHATGVMRSWLFQHLIHPYPTEDEKKIIAAQTNLTLLQVNNWFINARRRILQPMLDASSPEISGEQNFTLSKDQNVIVETSKFSWPSDEAMIQSQNANENSNESNFGESEEEEEEEEINDVFSRRSVHEPE